MNEINPATGSSGVDVDLESKACPECASKELEVIDINWENFYAVVECLVCGEIFEVEAKKVVF